MNSQCTYTYIIITIYKNIYWTEQRTKGAILWTCVATSMAQKPLRFYIIHTSVILIAIQSLQLVRKLATSSPEKLIIMAEEQ